VTVPLSVSLMRGWLAFLSANGCEPHLITSPGQGVQEAMLEGARATHSVPMRRQLSPLHDVVALVRLIAVLRRERYDVVHASTPKAGCLGILAAWLCRVPVRVFTLRGLQLTRSAWFTRPLLRFADGLAIRLANVRLAISDSLAQEAVENGLCRPDDLKVLGAGSSNGVDCELFGRDHPPQSAPVREKWGIPASATVVGYVGRLTRDKGILDLLDIWQRLRVARPQTFLVLVGNIEGDDVVTRRIEDAVRSGRVRVCPWQDRQGLVAAYEGMDIVVLPTHREGFGNVLLEAAAMEVPTVATRTTGCVDAVVDGTTGVLVQRGDPAAWLATIIELIDDPARRRVMGTAGRARAIAAFTPGAIWSERLDLMRSKRATAPLGVHR
jgi:glycosyltransferase involved in cell wall biosynthesis